MYIRRSITIVLVASAIMLAVGVGPRVIGSAQALPPVQEPQPVGATVPYPGRLADEAGEAVADGAYDFAFALYDTETGGEALWSEVQKEVAVQEGAFNTLLGSVNVIPVEALSGRARWLEVGVRGPGEGDFTTLTPRQRLSEASASTSAGPAATSNGLACPHDHFGENWVGSAYYGFRVEDTDPSGTAIVGVTTTGTGSWGVYGYSPHGQGVRGRSDDGIGVYAMAGGGAKDQPALRAQSFNTTNGMAAYMTNMSSYHTAHFDNSGTGGVLFLQNNGDAGGAGGSDFVTAVSRGNDTQFRVTSSGQGRSDVGFTTPAEDFAEMLPAVEELQPADVLVIGSDGKLTRSTEAYQASVAGVYSTQPGFLAGQPVEGEAIGRVPLALAGVVPVKASAENGAIRPGDLLATSSLPGHAMRAGLNPPQGTVIGKALESLESDTGIIKMLIVLQ